MQTNKAGNKVGADHPAEKNVTKASTNATQSQIEMLKLQIVEMQAQQEERMKEIQEKFANILNHVHSREASDRKVMKRLDDMDKDREREKDMIRRVEHNSNKRAEEQEERIEQMSKDTAALFEFMKNQSQRQEERDMQHAETLEFVRIQMRTTQSASKKREASDPLQRISQSMDVDSESVGSTASQQMNKMQGQVNEGEAEATQPLTQNE